MNPRRVTLESVWAGYSPIRFVPSAAAYVTGTLPPAEGVTLKAVWCHTSYGQAEAHATELRQARPDFERVQVTYSAPRQSPTIHVYVMGDHQD